MGKIANPGNKTGALRDLTHVWFSQACDIARQTVNQINFRLVETLFPWTDEFLLNPCCCQFTAIHKEAWTKWLICCRHHFVLWKLFHFDVFSFYPRPVLAFGYCRCLRLCVCVCLSVCLCVNHLLVRAITWDPPVQARIAKFGPKIQKTLVKVPIVLGGHWPWPSKSNLSSKSEFTPFWACPDHNSLPIQARITKFGPEVENSLVKVPIVLGGNWPRPSRSNLI